MARFSIASLLRRRRIQKDHANADLAAPVAYGTVVSAPGPHATIGGLDVVVGDVVAISGWEAIKGPRRLGCLEPGTEAEVVAVNRAEATVMPLVGGWTPLVGARVMLSRHGGLDP
ncbi:MULTISPECIES: hypothetical protein [Micrococcaceae]|jgi:hypothetical protein|uniref:Metalloproteinase n=3 Tax=Micrococcaceae TaxID=1268 RepID=Q6SK62_PAEAU|nr:MULTISPECIES: hypothetical protein [Micrococcaceae]AAS20110.1 metalloproteinase precursor [Paenarthrobacter aurescens]ABM10423.1 hypothetical protein AAur_pTC10152 [Paenarthrobacter aurescens TC1]SDQ03344.1 hypothetical protein SAMN04489742_0070 [Arthrobacter crystallopoietes]